MGAISVHIAESHKTVSIHVFDIQKCKLHMPNIFLNVSK